MMQPSREREHRGGRGEEKKAAHARLCFFSLVQQRAKKDSEGNVQRSGCVKKEALWIETIFKHGRARSAEP
jgi:hypothetical protein